MKDYLLDGAVALRRNYADLPFDAQRCEETARRVNERAAVALERSGDAYAYLLLSGLSPSKKEELARKRYLADFPEDAFFGAAYLRLDGACCVETAAEDHLLIAGYSESGELSECLHACRALEEQLKNTGRFEHSDACGFLTARPCDAGSGMRASLLLHLPMIFTLRQDKRAARTAGVEGMTLRNAQAGLIPPDTGLYLLENRMAAGREEAVLQRLQACAARLCEMEKKLRETAREKGDEVILDKVCRAYAVCRYARRITAKEAMTLWSMLTLGEALGAAPCGAQTLERLWKIALEAPEETEREAQAAGLHADALRAKRILEAIEGGNGHGDLREV